MDPYKIKKAIELSQQKKFDEAESVYLELLDEEPDNSKYLSAFGLFYVNIGNYKNANKYLKKACEIEKSAGTVSALGFTEYELGNFLKASQLFEDALSYGDDVNIYDKLILSLLKINSFEKAKKYADKMFELYPENEKAISNKIEVLIQLRELREAEILCVNGLKTNQESAPLWHHLGFLKEYIYQNYNQAAECFKISSNLGSKNADYNAAVCLQKAKNFEEAEKYYKSFMSDFPNYNIADVGLGMCYLEQKKFKEGYELFYKRKSGNVEKFTNNLWKPYDEIQNEIVIISDQGFGDNIQFVRYLHFLKDKKVKLAIREELKELFKANYPEFEFIDFKEINPQTQAFRITDLAFALNLDFDNIPFSEGYLAGDKLELNDNYLKIGLCWEAGAIGRMTINRTIHIDNFEPLMNISGTQIYSLQYEDHLNGVKKYPQMINLGQSFKDFSDTAKAINSMDIIITVDTATAHLAGALGKKTYLLLPYSSDWRWFNDNKTTPWYKSIEIFRQESPTSWQEPINNVIEKIQYFL